MSAPESQLGDPRKEPSGRSEILSKKPDVTMQTGSPGALPDEPQSSVTVLVDLSGTWLSPGSLKDDSRVLKTVAVAIAELSTEVDPPIIIRYLPIGDLSLGRDPLCQVEFVPKLLPGIHPKGEYTSLSSLNSYLGDGCVRYILARKYEVWTDITGALDMAGRAVEDQDGPFKALIMLSDLKEERRPNQKDVKLNLKGVHVLLLYRILNEDRINETDLNDRITTMEQKLRDAGATVKAEPDVAADAAQISRLLQQ